MCESRVWLKKSKYSHMIGKSLVLENVAFAVLHRQLEGQGCVVTLQDSGVIIEHSKFTACIAEERVGPSRVVHVMDCGGNQCCHLIQLVEAALGSGEARLSVTHWVQESFAHPCSQEGRGLRSGDCGNVLPSPLSLL